MTSSAGGAETREVEDALDERPVLPEPATDGRMTSWCQSAQQRRLARGHIFGADRLAVADHAGKTAFAKIDDKARAAVLIPLDIADMDGLRRHSPEANKEGRMPHVR